MDPCRCTWPILKWNPLFFIHAYSTMFGVVPKAASDREKKIAPFWQLWPWSVCSIKISSTLERLKRKVLCGGVGSMPLLCDNFSAMTLMVMGGEKEMGCEEDKDCNQMSGWVFLECEILGEWTGRDPLSYRTITNTNSLRHSHVQIHTGHQFRQGSLSVFLFRSSSTFLFISLWVTC